MQQSLPTVKAEPPAAILRHKTAIRRFQPSRPISVACEHGLISPDTTVFDYGCGRGDDVQLLSESGIMASGWDPHFCSENPIREADVVNLGYVLNVIEDPRERSDVLLRALNLARRALIVAVRVDNGPQSGESFNDGLITTRSGFQKLFKQSEFRSYLENVTGLPPAMAALGIAYLFKDKSLQSDFVATRSLQRSVFGRRHELEEFRSSDLGRAYLELARTLARLPKPREFPDFSSLRARFGSPQRIMRLASALLDPHQLDEVQRQRRENFLVYYAATRLEAIRLPRFSVLPSETQAEILSLWPSFKHAREEGEAFLFSLGDPERVRVALSGAPVGKLVGDSLYVHRSAEEQLPPLARLQLFAARQLTGNIEFDIVKLSTNGRKVSFLRYPEFDSVAHPALLSSLSVYLPKSDYRYREYATSDNPPVLHRKEAFVDETYPFYEKFASLTQQEEKRSLLSRPDIGLRQAWERLLTEQGLEIRGHRLLRCR
jgi:DNA phosphorothioation-associated putative methyltransferase